MYKDNKGLTLIALIITIIIMTILLTVGFKFGSNAIEKARLEDVRTNMISIKTKAKTIQEKYNFKDIESLVGTKLDTDDAIEGIQNDSISNELKTNLEARKEEDNTQYKLNLGNLYVWNQEDLNNQGLGNIKTDTNKFYIVYYNIEENTCEIYYSQGYDDNGTVKYSLTQLQEIQ